MIPCIFCGYSLDLEDEFCRKCGKSTRDSRRDAKRLSTVHLEISEEADLEDILIAVRGFPALQCSTEKIRQVLDAAGRGLDSDDSQMVIRFFGLDGGGRRSQKAIADEFGLSSTRVGNLINRTLRRMKHRSHWQ